MKAIVTLTLTRMSVPPEILQHANTGPTLTAPGAEWGAWLPGTFQVGRLVRRPGGTPHQMSKEGVERRGDQGPLARKRGYIICRGSPFLDVTAHEAGIPN